MVRSGSGACEAFVIHTFVGGSSIVGTEGSGGGLAMVSWIDLGRAGIYIYPEKLAI